jgi:hypothetical protein
MLIISHLLDFGADVQEREFSALEFRTNNGLASKMPRCFVVQVNTRWPNEKIPGYVCGPQNNSDQSPSQQHGVADNETAHPDRLRQMLRRISPDATLVV